MRYYHRTSLSPDEVLEFADAHFVSMGTVAESGARNRVFKGAAGQLSLHVEPEARVDIARAAQGDFFISIHADSSESRSVPTNSATILSKPSLGVTCSKPCAICIDAHYWNRPKMASTPKARKVARNAPLLVWRTTSRQRIGIAVEASRQPTKAITIREGSAAPRT